MFRFDLRHVNLRDADQRFVAACLTAGIIAACFLSFGKTETLLLRQYSCRIDINAAAAGEWQMLPGIGPKTAESILTYRRHQSFEKSRDLMNVKGIGSKKYEAVKPYLLETEPPSP